MAGPISAKLSGIVGGSSEINMEQKKLIRRHIKSFDFALYAVAGACTRALRAKTKPVAIHGAVA